MMNKTKGLTLTELIVATLVMGIIMIGMTSVDLALRQTHKGTAQSSLIAMQASAIMLRISKDAQLATGDRFNPGITVDATDIWIRMEDPTNPSPDPGDYTDDIWVSYTFDPATYTIYHCNVPSSGTSCSATDESVGKVASFVATIVPDDTVGTQNFHLEVTLTNRYDPTTPRDIFDNPEYVLTSRINPTSSSF